MNTLYVIATPIGNLGDISQRALDIIGSVGFIACEDTRQTSKLLARFNIKTPLVSYHKFNEYDKSDSIIDRILSSGEDAALVTDAGTPCISDPGSILVAKAIEAGIDVYAVPGACAIISALSVCGHPFTEFAFLGFFPREIKEKNALVSRITTSSIDTYVFYESPLRIVDTVEFIANEIGGNLTVCNDITKLHEKTYRGKAAQVLEELKQNENVEKGEYCIVLTAPEKKSEPASINSNTSLEAALVDILLSENTDIKGAISILRKQRPDVSKRDIFDASIRLKSLFNN